MCFAEFMTGRFVPFPRLVFIGISVITLYSSGFRSSHHHTRLQRTTMHIKLHRCACSTSTHCVSPTLTAHQRPAFY
eukprot:7390129-Prymnesium_polylepis.1